MYNYSGPPGQYNRPPGYGGYPGPQGAPPGMGGAPGVGPPGMAPPGVGLPPGMQQAQSPQPSGFPSSFQPPSNMPNINFTAPVIRLGTATPRQPDTQNTGPSRRDSNMEPVSGRRGAGLGYDTRGGDAQRSHARDTPLVQPTREEIMRTIYVGNITEGCGGDEGMERILNVAGGLRRWLRVTDANNQPTTFGFAEYEDADSLAIAAEIFEEVWVPTKRPAVPTIIKKEDEDDEPVDKTRLLVMVDDNSRAYINEWRSRGSLKDPKEAQFRIDTAKEDLDRIIASLFHVRVSNGEAVNGHDTDGDINMKEEEDKKDAVVGEIVTIPLQAGEDELSDVPPEHRESVAKEIAAFRERSNRRDIERLKREEEVEQAERQRNLATTTTRLGSPGPTGGTGIPSGPRDRGVQGAPTGPKGYQGVQIPRDYQQGVSFVNSNGFLEEEDDSESSDAELERRRVAKKEAEIEKEYAEMERKWIARERSRAAAKEREDKREKEEQARIEANKVAMLKRLHEWDDKKEAELKNEEYYRDHSQWLRNRAAFRAREEQQDELDRQAEAREKAAEQQRKEREMGMADQFLAQQATELEAARPVEQQRFKMSFGAAAQKAQAAIAPRRTLAEIEGFLEDDEDEAATTTKRTLIPLNFDNVADSGGMSEEERAQAARQLANEIPSDKEGLWAWDVKWEFVDDSVITEQLRPFVERRIVEYLGIQEQMLVDVVEETVRKRGKPQDLVDELEGALDEEAEALVKKLWRMLIFFSESEKRGLSAE